MAHFLREEQAIEPAIRSGRSRRHSLAVGLLAVLALTLTGCLGTVANLMHAALGEMVPAEFDGLSGKRVAVMCVSASPSFGPTTAADMIAGEVGKQLQRNIRKMTLIDPQKLQEWTDEHDWNQNDYLEIGKGVDADLLVAVELISFSLHEGQTMFKGRAEVEVTVYDIQDDGKRVYQRVPPLIQFPVTTGKPTTEISEPEFRRQFVKVLADQVARYFYASDLKDTFARDAAY